MGAITDAWCAFKTVFKETWGLMFDDGIKLEYKKCSKGGVVPDTYRFSSDTVYGIEHNMVLSAYTSLELLEEIIKRQSEENNKAI